MIGAWVGGGGIGRPPGGSGGRTGKLLIFYSITFGSDT